MRQLVPLVFGALIFIFVLLGSPPSASTDEVVLGLLSEPIIAEAIRATDETTSKLSKRWAAKWGCDYNGRSGYQCATARQMKFRGCGEFSYLAPFPVAAELPKDCKGYLQTYGWMTVDKVRDGAEFLQHYLEAAEQNSPSCTESTCSVIVTTNTIVFDGVRVSGWAKCAAEKVGNVLGPPGNCRVELLKFNEEYRVLVVSGFISAPALMGAPDFDIAVFATNKLNSNSLLAKVKSKLAESPLALSVDPRRVNLPVLGPTDSVIGVARHRRSPILPVWEWTTVRVDLYTPKAQSSIKGSDGRAYSSQSEIQVSLTLLLSPRNTKEYRLPEDVEFSQYLDIVKASIGLALEESCQKSEWLDGRTLICNAR